MAKFFFEKSPFHLPHKFGGGKPWLWWRWSFNTFVKDLHKVKWLHWLLCYIQIVMEISFKLTQRNVHGTLDGTHKSATWLHASMLWMQNLLKLHTCPRTWRMSVPSNSCNELGNQSLFAKVQWINTIESV